MKQGTVKADRLRELREAAFEAAHRMTAKKVVAKLKREGRAAAKKALRK